MSQNEKDAQQLLRKAQIEKMKQMIRKQYRLNLFNQILTVKSSTDSFHKEGKSDNEQLVRESYEIVKWAELVWFEENPESDDDYDVSGPVMIPRGMGGY